MLAQQWLLRKNLIAHGAREPIPENPVRSMLMPIQISVLNECPLTAVHITFAWFFSGVSALMPHSLPRTSERLWTKLARVHCGIGV